MENTKKIRRVSTGTFGHGPAADKHKMRKPTLTIHILSGVIDSVDGLPEGWTYQVIDHGLD